MIDLAQIFKDIPPQLATAIIAALPISELRGAIPVALGAYRLPVAKAFFWAVLGNMLPIFFLLWFWESASGFVMERSKLAKKFFGWIFERTRKKAAKKFMRYGQWFLVLFVAVPLPITGAWTGSVAAFLFGIPYKKALGLIFLGVLIAGVIVTLISTQAISLLKLSSS